MGSDPMLSTVHSTRTHVDRKAFFTQVPDALAEDPRLKTRDVTTVMGILRFARAKSWASMGNATLASMGRCTPRTIQLSLARLEAAGWIRRVETEAEIGSVTRRLIYLVWRESAANCAPPAPTIAPPPLKPIAPEPDTQENQTRTAGEALNGPRPDPQTSTLAPSPPRTPSKAPARPVTPRSACLPRYPTYRKADPMPADPELFRDWLSKPVGDPLRLMAERTLAGKARH